MRWRRPSGRTDDRDDLSAEWRRFGWALLFFVACLAVVSAMFLLGTYH